MADDLPSRDDIARGQTVEIVQEQDGHPGDPIVGDVSTVLTDEHTHPGGIKVELESGVVGRVKQTDPEDA
ncbi:YwbE family protein [Salinigranum sp.]|uniref:YwbE family protein n=1 Tax=Salinigranum sp. TaxID=1966351 RepID=UPI003564F90B